LCRRTDAKDMKHEDVRHPNRLVGLIRGLIRAPRG
jgi:hypothetical protein